jgi:hypothetical protein
MFDSFKKLYCPHCNALLGDNTGFGPDKCPFCGGIIWYTEGGTSKGWFKAPTLSIRTDDVIVIIMVACVLFIVLYTEFPQILQMLAALALKLLGKT